MFIGRGFALVLGLCAVASAEMMTIATFDDPAPDGSTPLFTFNSLTRTLQGSWEGTGLRLETITGAHDNARFMMPAIEVDAFGEVEPGSVEFFSSTNVPLLRIDFDSGHMSVLGFGGTEFLASDHVTFSGSILPMPTDMESFSFAFANQRAFGSPGSFTATTSFSSSANLIPEPASIGLMLLGSYAVFRRRQVSAS